MKTFSKSLVTIILILAVTMAFIPVNGSGIAYAEGETSGTCGEDMRWSLDEEGTLTISGTGTMDDFGYDYRYPTPRPWGTDVKKVIIEEGVNVIGNYAFMDCGSLTEVTMPNTLNKINFKAFAGCSALKEITIPDSVTEMGLQIFEDCTNLESAELSENTGYLGRTFSGCTSLTKVDIPYGVESLDGTFSGCTALTDIVLPSSVLYMYGTFYKCTGLTEIIIPDSVVFMGWTFFGCTGLTELDIPESVNELSDEFCSGCTGLKTVHIGGNVKTIGEEAFKDCISLSEVSIPDSVTELDERAFMGCTGLISATIGSGVRELKGTFRGCTGLSDVTMKGEIFNIGSYAFYGCSSLTSFEIPEGVTTIGDYAFQECTDMSGISLPSTLTHLGYYVFSDCSSLTDIIIPDSISMMRYGLFKNCTALTEITIPSGIRDITDNAFEGCTGLSKVFFTGSAPSISDSAFTGVVSEAYYPDDDTSWTEKVFKDYGGNITWKEYTVPETVIASGRCGDDLTWTVNSRGTMTVSGTGPMWDYETGNTLAGSRLIRSVVIGEGATTVGAHAFEYCSTSLKEVTLPETLIEIGDKAFCGCYELESFNLPESLEVIGDNAFSADEKFEYIVFPAGIKKIGVGAFYNCHGLKQAVFPGDAPEIGENAFGNDIFAAYYDDYNETWFRDSGTEQDVRQNYGGRICWACVMANPELPGRMAGATRQTTAVSISQATFDEGTENVIIASGDNYPDALAGGPLAYMLDAPILLVRRSQPDEATLNEIRRLGAKHAYILGGPGAVGENVADSLEKMGLSVDRISGSTRFETAVAVAEKMDELRGGKPLLEFFVYSHNYPDALAISNIAAILGSPILYIEQKGIMRDSVRKYMDSCGTDNNMVIIGGPALISSNAETELKKYGTPQRLYGSDRYETCVMINLAFRDIVNGDSICMACGTNYPDALSGGVFAAYCHAPLLLVRGSELNALQAQYVYLKAPVNVFAFGGTGVLLESIVEDARYYGLYGEVF